MTRAIVDTSVFISQEAGRPLDHERLDEIDWAVSIITVGELRQGVLNAPDPEALQRRLATFDMARSLKPAPVDEDAAQAWAMLRVTLNRESRRMPVNDSWIAATALSLGLPVVTQDDDYDGIPGLEVISV